MKRIIFLASVLLVSTILILGGPQGSPLFSLSLKTTSQNIIEKARALVQSKKVEPVLPEHLAADRQKVEAIVTELDAIKVDYQSRLAEYKKMDTDFTALIMKSRKDPNRELIKAKEAELEEKFQALTEALKNYQAKSQQLYQFQQANVTNSI